jgi:predicted enzyme related to lactoylglutathione lyase
MSLRLVSLYCADRARARDFYTQCLGLAIAPEFTSSEFVFLVAGGTAIALRPIIEAPQGAMAGAGSIELSFLVEDVYATRADLIAKGVEFTTEVGDVGAGYAFLARDTEGHLLAFAQLNANVQEGRAHHGV